MLLILPGISETVRPLSGTGVPIIFDFNSKPVRVAVPNTSLNKVPGGKLAKIDWSCTDWIVFHQGLVKLFKAGVIGKKIKYSEADAIQQANSIVSQHWADNATFFSSLKLCGYGTAFYKYFESVGMKDVVTDILQRISNTGSKFAESTVENVTKLASSAQNSLINVVDKTGKVIGSTIDTAGSFVGVVKYAVPVLIGGVVLFVGVYAYKNFIKGDSRISIPTPAGVVKV